TPPWNSAQTTTSPSPSVRSVSWSGSRGSSPRPEPARRGPFHAGPQRASGTPPPPGAQLFGGRMQPVARLRGPPVMPTAVRGRLTRRFMALAVVSAMAAGAGGCGGLDDPGADTHVTSPAWVNSHPVVLIDEGHHNHHTPHHGYRAFAALLSNDGYVV